MSEHFSPNKKLSKYQEWFLKYGGNHFPQTFLQQNLDYFVLRATR